MILVGDDVRSLAIFGEQEFGDSSRRLLRVRGSKREQFRGVLSLGEGRGEGERFLALNGYGSDPLYLPENSFPNASD